MSLYNTLELEAFQFNNRLGETDSKTEGWIGKVIFRVRVKKDGEKQTERKRVREEKIVTVKGREKEGYGRRGG